LKTCILSAEEFAIPQIYHFVEKKKIWLNKQLNYNTISLQVNESTCP